MADPPTGKPDPRQRLLAAAGPVFAARGYERATLREIASDAEVNVAAVAYYFGDKMGLYREVIQQVRQSREDRFPSPHNTDQVSPEMALLRLVRTMLSRMLNCDEPGWETQLLMREMDSPTPVFADLVNEFFRPTFNQLIHTLRRLIDSAEQGNVPDFVLQQMALSVVGQCLYYRIGRGVVDILIPQPSRGEHFDIDSLSLHVTSVMISATTQANLLSQREHLQPMLPHSIAHPDAPVHPDEREGRTTKSDSPGDPSALADSSFSETQPNSQSN